MSPCPSSRCGKCKFNLFCNFWDFIHNNSWLTWRTEEPLGSCSLPIITRSDLNSLLLLTCKKSDKNLPGHFRVQPYRFRKGEVLCVRKFSYVLVWRKHSQTNIFFKKCYISFNSVALDVLASWHFQATKSHKRPSQNGHFRNCCYLWRETKFGFHFKLAVLQSPTQAFFVSSRNELPLGRSVALQDIKHGYVED